MKINIDRKTAERLLRLRPVRDGDDPLVVLFLDDLQRHLDQYVKAQPITIEEILALLDASGPRKTYELHGDPVRRAQAKLQAYLELAKRREAAGEERDHS